MWDIYGLGSYSVSLKPITVSVFAFLMDSKYYLILGVAIVYLLLPRNSFSLDDCDQNLVAALFHCFWSILS